MLLVCYKSHPQFPLTAKAHTTHHTTVIHCNVPKCSNKYIDLYMWLGVRACAISYESGVFCLCHIRSKKDDMFKFTRTWFTPHVFYAVFGNKFNGIWFCRMPLQYIDVTLCACVCACVCILLRFHFIKINLRMNIECARDTKNNDDSTICMKFAR